MREHPSVFKGLAGSRALILGAALTCGAMIAGCGRGDGDGAGPIDTAAVTGDYAPPSEVQALAQPGASLRHFHPIARRVRHRHAGPR
jgi:hypothetical protein